MFGAPQKPATSGSSPFTFTVGGNQSGESPSLAFMKNVDNTQNKAGDSIFGSAPKPGAFTFGTTNLPKGGPLFGKPDGNKPLFGGSENKF